MKIFLQKWGTLLVLSLALAIVVIDTTLLNVSFATIIRELHTDIQSMQWVITAYALMLAAFTITGGRLGDIYGRKKMFIGGAVIFAIGSLLASFSTSVGMLIWGEAIIEGIGAALMLPATSSLLITTYQGRDRAVAFGVWGGVAGASSAIGPIVGGYLTTYFSWRWGFRINVIVVLFLLIGSFLIKENREHIKENVSLDEGGILLSAVGLLAIVFGIIESSQYGWYKAKQVFMIGTHPLDLQGYSVVIMSLIFGVIVLIGFIYFENWIESTGRMPLVSMRLFNNKQFTIGATTTAIIFLGQSGLIFSLPIFFQAVRGLDAFHTGLGLIPMSLTLLVMAPLSAFISKKITPRSIIQIGLIINMISIIVLYQTISVNASVYAFIPGLVLYGIGLGMMIAQVSNLTLSAVSLSEAGEASGVNNTFRQIGQTLGSAIIGAVLISTLTSNLSSGVEQSSVIPVSLKPQIAQAIISQTSNVEFGGGVQFGKTLPQKVQTEITNISHNATVAGNKQALLYAFLFAFWGFLASFLLPKKKVEPILDALPQGH